MAEQSVDKATEGTVSTPSIVDRFRQYLDQRVVEDQDKGGADQINLQNVTAILEAQTEDDVWDADKGGLLAAQNLVGTEVEIRSLIMRDRPNGEIDPGFFGTKYALMEAVALAVPEDVEATTGLQPGDEFVMDTGVATFISKVRWFEANGKMPVRGMIKGIGTASGNTVIQFTRPPKRAVQGQAADK